MFQLINFKIVLRIIGFLLMILAGFMLIPLAWTLFNDQGDPLHFAYPIITCIVIGLLLVLNRPKSFHIGKREGYLIVTFGWISLCFAGALPYLFTGSINSISSALFESTSGLTTTGATTFTDIESLSEGILLWRSLTQWIGGMGIIVLTIALFPLLGVSGVELFVAEAPGPTSEKIHPRIRETAKRLWFIYVGLTILLCILLLTVGELSFFDSLNHALTTMSTGGFSTKNASVAHFAPVVHYIIIFFMFLAGMNYAVIYFGLKGQLRRVWSSDEFKAYLIGMFVLVTVVGYFVYRSGGETVETSFRDAAFQVISVVTTTGYITADYTSWHSGLTILFFFLLFTGACAGSTSGGIKVVRHLVFVKNTFLEFKRLLHPRAVIRVKQDKNVVAHRIITHILVFLLAYLGLFVGGSLIMSIILTNDERPLLTAFGSVATCLGNVGPAFGSVGPVDNFAEIPKLGKNFLSVLMVIGRLELFTVLIVFTPFFWRAN